MVSSFLEYVDVAGDVSGVLPAEEGSKEPLKGIVELRLLVGEPGRTDVGNCKRLVSYGKYESLAVLPTLQTAGVVLIVGSS